jgi:hypothetical protein
MEDMEQGGKHGGRKKKRAKHSKEVDPAPPFGSHPCPEHSGLFLLSIFSGAAGFGTSGKPGNRPCSREDI